MTDAYDVLVVGAGIVGLAHAAAAADRGLSVVVIDRDHRAVGASVRNFGHICTTGQAGDLRDLALTARERWLELSERAGFWSNRAGGLAVARRDDELAVLEELSGQRDAVSMLTADEIHRRLGGAGAADIVGGAALGDDLRVDPRSTAPTIADWLDAQDDVEFRWNTSYLGSSGRDRHTSRGVIRADRAIVCVGHDLDRLYPDVAAAEGVQRCSLSMLSADPGALRIEPAVLTATSLLRYPAFTETDAAGALRARLTDERPDLMRADTNIMVTQRPDGTLLLGDSHTLDDTVAPFVDEAVSTLIHRAIGEVLGDVDLTIRQRWQGVYASRPGGPYLVRDVDDDVTLCTVTTGVGMTIAFGLAERTMSAAAWPAPETASASTR